MASILPEGVVNRAVHLSIDELLQRAEALGFRVRIDPARPSTGIFVELPQHYHDKSTADVDLPDEVRALLRREREVAVYLNSLRAPATKGTVPAASPGGEDGGASACADAPLVEGGQGRTSGEILAELKALSIVAVLFVLGVVTVVSFLDWLVGPVR